MDSVAGRKGKNAAKGRYPKKEMETAGRNRVLFIENIAFFGVVGVSCKSH
jgi:hypothetical protein